MKEEKIQRIIANLERRFDTDNLWRSDEGDTAFIAIGNLWEAIAEEIRKEF